MKTINCDWCKAKTEFVAGQYSIHLAREGIVGLSTVIKDDLCPACTEKFREFRKGQVLQSGKVG